MGVQIYQVDAFTDKPFAGNPAAVCILPKPRDATWMQNVAQEMNLSETAFLAAQEDGFDLRWFTPVVEVKLCGHATLASAHILWEIGVLAPQAQARFHTHSGLLTAEQDNGWIVMDFPATPVQRTTLPLGLADALGVTPEFVGKSQFDFLVRVDSEDIVRNLEVDIARVKALGVRGICVTARATTPGFDFVSRFFAPGAGIDEDPVTGSAHCCLGPYWSRELGKNEFTAYQASARGGMVRVQVVNDRVRLGGQAVTTLQGELVNC